MAGEDIAMRDDEAGNVIDIKRQGSGRGPAATVLGLNPRPWRGLEALPPTNDARQ
jgi:hypothetical protein